MGNMHLKGSTIPRRTSKLSTALLVALLGVFAIAIPAAALEPAPGFLFVFPTATLNFPNGMDVDASGNVYVADTFFNRIQKFDANGTFISTWGKNGGDGSVGNLTGEFNTPNDVGVDKANSVVYVAYTENDRIQKFDLDGNFLLSWGSLGTTDGLFDNPAAVEVGSTGIVYVADTNNRRVQRFNSAGVFIDK